MSRSYISIVLIVLHLASQVALAPHAHGNAHPDHDEARPHVHLGWLGWHTHNHSHTHEHDAIAPHSHLRPTANRCLHIAVDCHDCDAVYLPTEIAVPALKGGKELGQVAVGLATVPIAAVMWTPPEPPERLMQRVLPDASTPSCPRYLMLRAMRI